MADRLTGGLLRHFSARGLRVLLASFFLALAVPTAALIWQAYSQLKWEAFYQYRNMAEELTDRIDADLIERVNRAEDLTFGDFAFLVVSGEPAGNYLQRSPLSDFPVSPQVPGLIGYFQVDADGVFSTPLLPPGGSPADRFGISAVELDDRKALAARIGSILADNRLVRERPALDGRSLAMAEGRAAASPASVSEDRPDAVAEFAGGPAEPAPGLVPEDEESPARQSAKRKDDYSQQVFDDLNSPATAAGTASMADRLESDADLQRNAYSKVADLKLDASLEKKSESATGKGSNEPAVASKEGEKLNAANRARRLEQSTVPASTRPSEPGLVGSNLADATGLSRISTFASEIDPYEFSLLDSGHLVLFRKVWRNDERFIQGLLIDTPAFVAGAIERQFRLASLSAMSDLVVGYQDDVITVIRGGADAQYTASSSELQGTLLYRSRLSAPLDRLALIYSINRLPPGPGASVLLWTSIIIAIVFLAGFSALYRLALGQINLARKQQDFVSAVSHELKTPLTSIRMYGEMLREGWVSEDKRKQYYEFIHDESERLTRLISNVLQLANITRNSPEYDLKPRPVCELMNLIESKIGNQVERAGFLLNVMRSPASEAACVNIDEDCFAQIVINLVDNAIKFSKKSETKTIELGSNLDTAGNVTFTVRDFGPGIAKDQMKKIFQLFYRTESELTRETVGTGIGLAIVHQLAVAMAGSVDVLNRNPGAEFRVSFPAVSR